MKYIDIGDLWRLANVAAKREISQNEVSQLSGVTQATLSKMKRGGKCDVAKMAKVAEALYHISGLPRPYAIMIAWIE